VAGTHPDPLSDSARIEPVRFLQTCFQPNDWIAVFLKNYQNGRVAQHIGPLSWAMSDHVQAWLHAMNARRFNVYVSVNAREEGHEFSVLLSFPGARGPRYPIRGYPAINEFRAMLTALDSDGATRAWSGGYFVGGVATPEKSDTDIWFRAHDNGITFRFSAEDRHAVHALVRRAWQMSDIRMAWDALAIEYGEL
jgi:hypothetical protein